MNASSCPALLVSGCASGQGKTTVTAALARYHSRAGCRVRVFKTGPDFIDPMVLEAASAAPVYNLDCWMVGIEASRALLATAAAVFLNMWLASRIGRLRREQNVSIGHGHNAELERRMRAQANFIENTPLFLILMGAVELSRGSQFVLGIVAAAFLLSRVAHAFGMEGGTLQRWRTIGILGSFLTTAVLAVWAIGLALSPFISPLILNP